MAVKKPENLTFEETIKELDNVVNQLENGDLPLEDALKKFERGIALSRTGQEKLTQAEQRVEILLNGNSTSVPFDSNTLFDNENDE